VLQLISLKEETENKFVQLKKEDTEIQEKIAVSDAACVKTKQEEEMLQADYQKVGVRNLESIRPAERHGSVTCTEQESVKLSLIDWFLDICSSLQLETEALKLQSQIVESADQLEAKLNCLRECKEKYEADKQQLTEVKQEKIRQKDLYKKFLHVNEEVTVKLKDIAVDIKHYRSVPADALEAPDVPLGQNACIRITIYK
jgi:hypothetical protein